MNIRRKPSGRWEVRVHNVPARTFRTKKEAEAWGRDQETAKHRGTYVDPNLGRVTLQQWWGHYQQTGAWLRLAETTQETYSVMARKHILPRLGMRPLATLRPGDVDAWMALMHRDGVGNATINSSKRVLSRMLEVALKDGRIGKNPAKEVSAPRSPREEMRFLSPPEIEELADAIEPCYRAMVLTLAYTGLRIGEATALRTENLDLLRGRIQVVEAYRVLSNGKMILGPPKTEAGRRSVTLPGSLRQILGSHLDTYPRALRGEVFTTVNGAPVNRQNFGSGPWQVSCRKANLTKPWPRVHDLRHTAVALAIAAGAHPKAIQGRMGHANITTTLDRYGHLLPGMDDALADRLDKIRTASGSELVRSWSEDSGEVLPFTARA